MHNHIDYSASCSRDHRTTTGHRLQYGSRTGIKTNRRKHSKKATAKRGQNVIVWPLSAHLSTVGKVRWCVWRPSTDQQQCRTFPAERFVGSQQRRHAFISGQFANKKEELLRQARWNVFGSALSRFTCATQDDLIKDEIRYNADVWARRDMVANCDSVAHADHVVNGPILPWAHQRRSSRSQWSHSRSIVGGSAWQTACDRRSLACRAHPHQSLRRADMTEVVQR